MSSSDRLITPKVISLKLTNHSNMEPPTPVSSTPKSKPAKTKAKDKIIYPEYIEASNEISDPFWINILQDMATGKFLPSFVIRDKKLYYRFRNTIEYINLSMLNSDNIDYQELANITIDFIRNHGKIYSPWDHEQQLLDIEEISKINNSRVHSVLATSNSRNQCFYLYAYELVTDMNLDQYYISQLYELLNLGYFSGIITKNNISINNGLIVKIDNIFWNPQLNQFCINPQCIEQALQKKSKNEYLIAPVVKHHKGVNIDEKWNNTLQTIH